ncbi:MAG: 30S ribosomal protein S18 [Candidatus Improbicoccus pseudotrichonymphae]|uniref:Small ribosomal subunit protein bS18 n=1 Tax=Candidatus Improbicoccus pseudotrichonymphae TaxID=3033792 RepID=A0AA48L0U0_9FIRM|nr:MAG: 30S ribosomal protein S18 [Candidatus Improbicoccus pseudotrichonymphae]
MNYSGSSVGDSGGSRSAENVGRIVGNDSSDNVNKNKNNNENRSSERKFNDNEKRFRKKKRVCVFCVDKNLKVDLKDVFKIKKFTSERAKILPRRVTKMCSRHQKVITLAIKRARYLALLAYRLD